MSHQSEKQPPLSNPISDGTGEYDPRFVLWRKFCADQAIPVETLPGDLDPEAKKLWERIKEGEIGSK